MVEGWWWELEMEGVELEEVVLVRVLALAAVALPLVFASLEVILTRGWLRVPIVFGVFLVVIVVVVMFCF